MWLNFTMSFFKKLLELTRPLDLLLTTLCYGLGLGIARYLGVSVEFAAAFLGGVVLLLILAAARMLEEFYRFPQEPYFPDDPPARWAAFQRLMFNAAIVLLGMSALLVSLMGFGALLNPTAGFFLGAILLVAVAFGVPPLRWVDRGFGEFGLALLMGVFAPALAFSLQTGGLHRLLPLLTLPLFALALACLLAFDFPDYAADLKRGRRTMLIRLTWQRAIQVHNLLLATAYLSFAASAFMGLSLALIWPALLTLPLAAYQVFMLNRISDGAKPVWPAFKVNAAAIFGVTAYLLTLTFWLR